jgi:hypothetical protein
MLSVVTSYWHKDLRQLHLYLDEERGHDPVAVLHHRWYWCGALLARVHCQRLHCRQHTSSNISGEGVDVLAVATNVLLLGQDILKQVRTVMLYCTLLC